MEDDKPVKFPPYDYTKASKCEVCEGGDIPCYDRTMEYNTLLQMLIEYRWGTRTYLKRVVRELKRTTTKHGTRGMFPFEVILNDNLVDQLTTIMEDNVRMLKNSIKVFHTNMHKQFMLSFIETDIAYLEKWIGLHNNSINPKFNNADFIGATQKNINILDNMRLYVMSIPVRGE